MSNCSKLLKMLKVLLVEDEEHLLSMLGSTVGEKFGKYMTATNGAEAIEIFVDFKPDIIISDITMPVMDGLSMAENIHTDHPNLPIVILSAYSDKDKLLGAIDAGIAKYFIKPFDPDELLEYLCIFAKKRVNSDIINLSNGYIYDKKSNKLFFGHSIVKLTIRELDLIAHLIEKPDHLITNDELKDFIGNDHTASDQSMRVFIRRLREKTDKDFIQNISKQGYMLKMD